MDSARRQRGRGIGIVLAVLVVVCAWWLLFFPRSDFYKNYKQKSDLEKILRAIPPPAGAALVQTDAITVSGPARVILRRFYQTPSGFDVVESHYKQEFPRQGFVYQPKPSTWSPDHGLTFCAPGYVAILAPPPLDGRPAMYRIFLYRSDEC
jgi:hypothetical protein